MKTKKQQVKQRIVATLVTAFMFVMISGCYNVSNLYASTGWNVTLIQNIVAGTLNIDSLSTLGFNDITVGIANNSLANLSVVNMQDYRGNGQGWTVTAVCNALTTLASGTNTIANSSIFINTGSVHAVSGSIIGVATSGEGSWQDLQSIRTLVNTSTASNAGMGSYNISNTTLNVVYNGRPDQKTGTYQNLLTLTIASN
jgi:hypothetical protein